MTDCRMDRESQIVLKGLIGHEIESVTHDAFYGSPVVLGTVAIRADGCVYELNLRYRIASYFGEPDELASFSFQETGRFDSMLQDSEISEEPVKHTLRDVLLVDDRWIEREEEGACGKLGFTRAVIFVFGGKDLLFELCDPMFDQMKLIWSTNAVHELGDPMAGLDNEERARLTVSREFVHLKEW